MESHHRNSVHRLRLGRFVRATSRFTREGLLHPSLASSGFGEVSKSTAAQGSDETVWPEKEGSTIKILVVGGTGKVGAEVVKELQKRKADIRLLVRKEDAPTRRRIEVAIGDLLDPGCEQEAGRFFRMEGSKLHEDPERRSGH